MPPTVTPRVLRALTAAALALPGLLPAPALSNEEPSIGFQYGYYDEGNRDLVNTRSRYEPIHADTLHYRLQTPLGADTSATLDFSQDTWSGATPIATAPLVGQGNRATAADGVSGASPYLYSALQLDRELRPLGRDVSGQLTGPDTRVVHTMSSASPETRKQIDAAISRAFGRVTADASAGLSHEDDYNSVFAGMGADISTEDKLATAGLHISYTRSDTDAELDHDAAPYIYGFYDLKGTATYNARNDASRVERGTHGPRLRGLREDLGLRLSASRVLNQSAFIEGGLSWTRSSGYLGNPYKAVTVAFLDPAQQFGTAGGNTEADYAWDATMAAIPESRPELRQQGSLDLRLVQHIAAVDAALHLGYRYFRDDWGINSHTFEAAWAQPLGRGWTLTPSVRFYSQSRADFHTPWLLTQQGLFNDVIDPVFGRIYVDANAPGNGSRYYEDLSGTVVPPMDEDPDSWNYGNSVSSWNGGVWVDADSGQPVARQSTADALVPDRTLFDPAGLPDHYASDARLSGFGTLGIGIAAQKVFANGLSVEFAWRAVRHAGSLKLGGGGEQDYADFRSSLFSVSLQADLDAVGGYGGGAGMPHHGDSAARAPAGLMQAHATSRPGEWMLAYRYELEHRGGQTRRGSSGADDGQIVRRGCDSDACYVRPDTMTMQMHMLEIMYALTPRLSLMLMPQYMDMEMRMRPLDGAPPAGGMQEPVGAAVMHAAHPHESGEPGDTEFHLLYQLPVSDTGRMLFGIGLSAPTGKVDLRLRPVMQQDLGYMDYGMQIGSGTWDIKPALAWSAGLGRAQWGLQLAGTAHLEDRNDAGFALGTQWQADVWIAYPVLHGVSVSLHGTHSHEGRIRGTMQDPFTPISTVDHAANYGGTYQDIGIGIDIDLRAGGVPLGRVGLEWQQPVGQDVNGYQLAREGSLLARWERAF